MYALQGSEQRIVKGNFFSFLGGLQIFPLESFSKLIIQNRLRIPSEVSSIFAEQSYQSYRYFPIFTNFYKIIGRDTGTCTHWLNMAMLEKQMFQISGWLKSFK